MGPDTQLLAAGPLLWHLPNPSNGPVGKHFRSANGGPRLFEIGNGAGNDKRATAIGVDTMLEGFCLSILHWLLLAAAHGRQRWFCLKNGLAPQIWGSQDNYLGGLLKWSPRTLVYILPSFSIQN